MQESSATSGQADLIEQSQRLKDVNQGMYDENSNSAMNGFLTVFKQTGEEVTNLAALVENGLGGSLDIASTAFQNLALTGKMSIRGMVADMLTHLTELLMHQAFMTLANMAMGAVMNSFATPAVASGGNVAQGLRVPVRHTGGMADMSGATRVVPAGLFRDAPRYHNGTLSAGEIPAILQRGEGVFTREQMKNLAPAGGGGVVISQNFTVNVEGGSDKGGGEGQGEKIAKELRQQMKAAVMEVLIDQKRHGGVLA